MCLWPTQLLPSFKNIWMCIGMHFHLMGRQKDTALASAGSCAEAPSSIQEGHKYLSDCLLPPVTFMNRKLGQE